MIRQRSQVEEPPFSKLQPFPALMAGRPTGRIVTPRRWQRELALFLDAGSAWDRGVTRKDSPNEDCLATLQGICIYNEQLLPFGLYVVADGMGGHAYGKDASYLAIQALTHFVLGRLTSSEKLDEETLPEVLAEGARRANFAVYQRSMEVCAYMGTTITAALVIEQVAYVINVGDSRTYLYRENEGLTQITRDHSVVARLVETGLITPDEVYSHPNRNQVYRGLGNKAEVEVDSFKRRLRVDDRLLLCSDGLWEMVRNPHITHILKQPARRPAEMSQRLIEAAIEGGGQDNISVIVVHVAPVTG